MLAIGAQAIGQHASRRAGTNDDIIELGGFTRTIAVHGLPAQRAIGDVIAGNAEGLQ
jgi:hypothetical protein